VLVTRGAAGALVEHTRLTLDGDSSFKASLAPGLIVGGEGRGGGGGGYVVAGPRSSMLAKSTNLTDL
jgi:hypothetical protein